MNTLIVTKKNETIRISAPFIRLLVVLLTLFTFFQVGPVQAYADDIGTITHNGSTKTYDSLSDLAEDLDDYDGETIVVEMLRDWDASWGHTEFDYRLFVPEDSNFTLNMHGHVFNRNNVNDDDNYSPNGEVIYIDTGATVTINGASNDEEKQTVHEGVRIFTDVNQEIARNTTTIKGAVIAGGNSTGGTGGIYIDSGKDCVLNDVTIAGCKAENSINPTVSHHDDGGGVLITESDTKLKLNNSTITGCLASGDGGAIMMPNDSDKNVSIELDNSHIDKNYANDSGGAINLDGTNVSISGKNGSTISNNVCLNWGGGVFFWNDDATLSGLTMDGNKSDEKGGAVYLRFEHYTLKDLTITNNRASYLGGGIYVGNDYVTIENCTITGNDKHGVYVESHCDAEMLVKGGTVIKDNKYGNLTLQDETCLIDFEENDKLDIHIGYVDLPDKADGYKITPNVCLDISDHFAADNDGYEVVYSYRNHDGDDGSRLYYIKKSDESDDRGHPRVIPDVQTIATQDVHGYSVPMTVYAGGYTADEGGSGTTYQMRSIYAHRTSSGDRDYQTYYTDGFFFDDPIIYNDHLATASYGLATTGAYLDGYDDAYNYKHAGARQYMADIGCPDQMIYVNDCNIQKPGTDTIGVTIASKVLQAYDGSDLKDTDYTLIAIAVRGANYGNEWASNVTLGGGSEHDGEAQGFSEAADQVMEAVDYYIAHYGLQDEIKDGKVKFWVSGFSRAGATSNLTSKRLIERYCADTGDPSVTVATGNQVFAYPCEAPKGGTDKAEKLSDKTAYYCIHNLVNAGDVVPLVAPVQMGFKRYGVDHYIPGTHIGRVTRDEYLNNTVKTVVAAADGASSESGVTQSTNYVDNVHLYTKKDMEGGRPDRYVQYETRRDNMVKHLARIKSSMLYSDYFYPYTDMFSDPYYKKLGDFDGAKVEDYLTNFIAFLQQETMINRDKYATIPVTLDKEYDTLQDFARTYISGGGDTERRIEALKTALADIKDSLGDNWWELYSDIGMYWFKDTDERVAQINYFWNVADEAGAFKDLTAEDIKVVKVYWFTLMDTAFHFIDGDWDLGSDQETWPDIPGIPQFPTGTRWVNGSVGGGSLGDNLIYTLTLAVNADMIININHDMGVGVAWARTYDSYYGNPETGEPKDLDTYYEYKAHWVSDGNNPDNYTVEAPGAFVKNDDPSATEPYRALKPTPDGEAPKYNLAQNTQKVLLEVGKIYDSASPADVTQGTNGDYFGEAIYYSLYDVSNDESLLVENELYRGGVDLSAEESSDGIYKIVAKARSLGQFSDEVVYYISTNHEVTVDDGSGQDPVVTRYNSGDSVTLVAKPAGDKMFTNWTVELLDASGETVESDIAEAILNGKQKDSATTFTMPEDGAEYASGKTYPSAYGLRITAVCEELITKITPSSVPGDHALVPAADPDPNKYHYLANTADLSFMNGDESEAWDSPNNPYQISWTFRFVGDDTEGKHTDKVYPASGGDLIYGECEYTATIIAPKDAENSVLFASEVTGSPSPEMEGTYSSFTVVRDPVDGTATITIVFNPTGNGPELPDADNVLKLTGVDYADNSTRPTTEELGECGYVRQGQTIQVTAKEWPGYQFLKWAFEDSYQDEYVKPKETTPEYLENKTITITIGDNIDTEHGPLCLYAYYLPVHIITDMAVQVEAPVGGEALQRDITDQPGRASMRIKMDGEWYRVMKDYINPDSDPKNDHYVRWSPGPVEAGDEAKYLTAYTASLQMVPDLSVTEDYWEMLIYYDDESTIPWLRSGIFVFDENINATMNEKPAEVDADTLTLSYTFPRTEYSLEKVYAPEDVTDIPYGTAGDALKPYLPQRVNILLSNGQTTTAPVIWGDPKMAFGPLDEYAMHVWMANGSVQLPFGVGNPHEISLDVVGKLFVNAAECVEKAVPSVDPGAYWHDQEVTLSSETEGATIYWTCDPNATDVVEDVPGDSAWQVYDGSVIELNRDEASEAEIGPDGEPTGRKMIHLRTAAFKDGMRPDGVRTYPYVFSNEVKVPEGKDSDYTGRPQVGVTGSPYYELEAISEDVRISADGDAIAMNPGTYKVKAKIKNDYRWKIEDPETGEITYTREDQTVTFTISRDKWIVFYDANGGTKAPHSDVVNVGESYIVTSEKPEGGDLRFKGWATDPDAAQAEYQPGDTLQQPEGQYSVVLYALWELDPAERPILITYDANGEQGAQVPSRVWTEADASIKLGAAYSPLGGRNAFLGWSEDRAATEPSYRAGQECQFSKDTTLYAVWRIRNEATLTFADPLPDEASGMPEPIAILPSMSPYVRIPSVVPEKPGRAFVAWNTAEDGSGTSYAPGSVIVVREDTTLWAQWELAESSWYVVYDANGGTKAPDPQIVAHGEDAVLVNELPQGGGLIFKGWATSPDAAAAEYQPGGTLPYNSEKNVVVLYALWSLAPIHRPAHVSFDANGVPGAKVPSDVWLAQDTWLQLEGAQAPLGSDRAFLGWSKDPDATEPQYRPGQACLFGEDTTLYAVWEAQETATLTFADPLPDPATGIPEPITITTSMSPYVRIPSTIPEKPGRVFTGWNTAEDGSGRGYEPGSEITLRGDKTLYAQWEVAESSWYVVYDANGGTKAPGAQIVAHGEDAVLSGESPEAGTMVFKGWATSPDAAEAAYQPGDTLPYSSEKNVVVLYALWSLDPVERPVHVSFDVNGVEGAKVPADVWFARDTWLQLEGAQAPLGGRDVFLGWSKDPDATEPEYQAGESYCCDQDTTLYAVWGDVPTATLTFADPLPDEASGIPDPISIVPSMSPYVRIPSTVPQKPGRVFVAWNTAEDGSGESYAPGATVELLGDMTLWAQWEVAESSWYVVYDANGGTWAPGTQIVPKGEDAVLSAEPPVAGAMVFRGWATSPDAAEAAYQPGDTLPYDSEKTYVVLYALWELNPPAQPATITYDLNGGTYGGSSDAIVETHEVGSVISVHAAPVRDGYRFLYWKGSEYQPGDAYTVVGDHTFVAQWEKAPTPSPKPEPAPIIPQTGDPSFGLLGLGMAAVALAALAFGLVLRKE